MPPDTLPPERTSGAEMLRPALLCIHCAKNDREISQISTPPKILHAPQKTTWHGETYNAVSGGESRAEPHRCARHQLLGGHVVQYLSRKLPKPHLQRDKLAQNCTNKRGRNWSKITQAKSTTNVKEGIPLSSWPHNSHRHIFQTPRY